MDADSRERRGQRALAAQGDATATENLRKEAVARGVAAERLIFAGRMPPADHLARHRAADLCLDTLPYNAHTTACDALWAGLPFLTCLGETFVGRVAASLLGAVGLPEFVTTDLEAYERLAIEVATDRLAAIKRKLAANRIRHAAVRYSPLHATYRSRLHHHACAALRAGLAPDDIAVSDGWGAVGVFASPRTAGRVCFQNEIFSPPLP